MMAAAHPHDRRSLPVHNEVDTCRGLFGRTSSSPPLKKKYEICHRAVDTTISWRVVCGVDINKSKKSLITGERFLKIPSYLIETVRWHE